MEWGEMVRLEPRLEKLEEEIRALQGCGEDQWYGSPSGLKYRMAKLAGFGAANPALRTHGAYVRAYAVLYAALPKCEGCEC